ncbi:MAG TPA: hypothetical protein VN723_15075 [Rhizomicrobium sp.]|jgi:hypothetical protein|nr:hypothetical protein [Rhizomicrobium sp.]
MNAKFALLSAVMMLGFGALACAPGAEAEEAAQAAQVTELLDIFNRGCLHAMPSLDGFAAGLRAAKLSPDDFARAVPDKTGDGWAINGKAGKYVLLHSQGLKPGDIALLPGDKNEVCTVTTTGRADLPVLEPFRALKVQYAAEAHTTLVKPTHPATIQGGPEEPPPSFIEMQITASLSGLLYVQSLQPGGLAEYRLEYRPSPYTATP